MVNKNRILILHDGRYFSHVDFIVSAGVLIDQTIFITCGEYIIIVLTSRQIWITLFDIVATQFRTSDNPHA
jgi:hypothetical protein